MPAATLTKKKGKKLSQKKKSDDKDKSDQSKSDTNEKDSNGKVPWEVRKNWKCHHCGKTDHKKPDCWELNPDKKPNGNKSSANQNQSQNTHHHHAHVASTDDAMPHVNNLTLDDAMFSMRLVDDGEIPTNETLLPFSDEEVKISQFHCATRCWKQTASRLGELDSSPRAATIRLFWSQFAAIEPRRIH